MSLPSAGSGPLRPSMGCSAREELSPILPVALRRRVPEEAKISVWQPKGEDTATSAPPPASEVSVVWVEDVGRETAAGSATATAAAVGVVAAGPAGSAAAEIGAVSEEEA
mmetsp:Transcript_1788/g.4930  ORF Transcript_1788/g.4930 Transcript_1788/m.4930 type:complete len:110 (-) Transcript_1788:1541-1870(-)